MKKLLGTLILLSLSFILNAQQVHVNREWRDYTGNPVFNPILNPFGAEWTKSIPSATAGLITVGHTQVSGQGENILITKYDDSGSIIWQSDYNTGGTRNDYGIDLIEDATSGYVYIVGTTDNGGTTDYDVVVLVYDNTGSLQYSTTYDANGLNDIGTAINFDSNGYPIVCASSENSGTMSDFLLLSYDPTLTFQWTPVTYDYSSLIDVPVGIEAVGGKILVAGASANSLTDWDYTVVEFDETNGSYLADTRDNIPGVGYDQPLAFVKDASNNTYVTGRASTDGINYNIRSMKINANSTIAWTQTIDANGLEDCGNTIVVDGSGNVIVGGFITRPNNIKEIFCAKYNSSGTLLWQHSQPSKDMTADSYIRKIVLNANNDIYFIAGEKGYTGNKEVIVGKIKANGKKSWERQIKGNYDYLPSDIQFGGGGSPGLFTIAIKDSTINVYEIANYSEHERDTARVFKGNGKPWYKKNEMIVRFQASAMDTAAINNHVGTALREYGDLSSFLTYTAYSSILDELRDYCSGFCDIKAVKIFDDPTTFTATTSRLGETIPVPDFWSALLLEFPSNITTLQANNAFKNIPDVVVYSHPNYILSLNTPLPNDTSYKHQYSIKTSTYLPNGGINAEEAWDVIPSGGDGRVKVGIFDSGIDWQHSDFDYDGSLTFSTKISGWNIALNTQITSNPSGDLSGHGTAVAGIIGATRNNTIGISGIAGGDWTSGNNNGIRIFSYNVIDTISQDIMNTVNAITGASKAGHQYVNFNSKPLNLMNNCWFIDSTSSFYNDTAITLLTEAVHFVNRQKVTFVAARGNKGFDDRQWPAIIDDDWVLSVGGIGSTGNYKSNLLDENSFGCSYGHNVDIAAPATYATVYSTYKNNLYYNFHGTSAAAPHVTGVAGLLMSYMNNPNGGNDPNNLAPEDVEFIIQESASAMPNGASLPNDSVGYGRLNAGKALRMVEKPYRTLYHFNTNNQPNTVAKSVYSNSVTVTLTEWYQNIAQVWYKPGKYVVKTFLITDNFNHSFTYATDSLMYCWLRPSSSEVLELYDINNRIKPRQRVNLNSYSATSAYMQGYAYQVWDSTGTNQLGWWPCDTSFNAIGSSPLFSYSMLTKNKAVGIDENTEKDLGVNLFPNPATNQQTLKISTQKSSNISIQLYDVMGRLIKSVYFGKTMEGDNIYQNDVSGLPNSMYLYVIKIDAKPITKRFIKQ